MKRDTKLLLLASAAVGAGYVIYTVRASRSSESWYWAYLSQRPEDQPAINEFFLNKYKGTIFIRKTVSPQSSPTDDPFGLFPGDKPASWILFEARGPFEWTLPGKPSPAPKGAATESSDIMGDEEVLPAITSPEHPWNKFWGAFWSDGSDGKPANPILSTWSALGSAGPIVVYGGAAVILFKLWRALSTAPAARSSSPRPRQLRT